MTPIRCAVRSSVATMAVILALACDGTYDDDPTGNAGTYSLSMTPGALTIRAGATGAATININRTNYTGGVEFLLVSPPGNISAAFTSSTANTAEMVVTVGTSVPPGNYALAIRSIAGDFPYLTLPLPLTVVAAPAAGQVEYLYCDPTQAPAFFAYQDGTNDWQAVTPSTSSGVVRFRINLTSNRGGVMAVFRTSVDAALSQRRTGSILSGKHLSPGTARRLRHSTARRPRLNQSSQIIDVYQTAVLYGTASELADDGALTCAATLPTRTVIGTVTGVSAGQYGIVTLPNATEIFEGGVSTNPVTFSGVPLGWVDLVASRLPQPGMPPNRGVILRDLFNIANAGLLPSPIDFNGPSSFVPATATVDITGAAGDNLEVFTGLVTATGGDMGFWFELSSSTASSRPWAGLNAENMRPGEFHSLAVFASPPASNGDFRVAVKYPGPVANETIAIGSTVNLPSVSEIEAGAYPRYRFQGSLPAEYNRGVTIALDPEDVGNAFFALATTSYLAAAGAAQAYDLAMPNVSALPGFPAAARIGPGLNFVTVDAFGFTGPGSFDVTPALGREFKASDRVSPLIVP